ncbi:ATP-binding protein [Elongatibacter sediminis]|uniref:histidine kinase n=1 Tax=Elongatibacter sediminis TaxID=3119006 RepID=A0AAW9RJB1_9GAMM
MSLRVRFALVASLVLVLALSLVGVALDTANQRSAVTGLRDRMESYVYQVLAAIDVSESGSVIAGGDLGDPRLNQPGSGVYVHVHGVDDHWSSPSSLGLRVPELQSMAPGESVFRIPSQNRPYFAFQYGVGWQLESEEVRRFTVSVLIDPGELERQTAAFRRGLWRTLALAGVILLLAQVATIYLAFRPLQAVARDVARVESGDAPALDGAYPAELEPLARNVNRLLATEKANQERYRNALDSLAHSLKTPLAVLRAGLETREQAAAAPLRKAVEEMNRLVTTRLQRAAVSARRTMGRPEPVEPVVRRIIASLEKVHSRKMIQAEVIIDADAMFCGEERDLMELMGNLLDNAFKYGARRVRLTARSIPCEGGRPGLAVRVEDDGPGIDPVQWPLLLERGVRGDERVDGHGLGLAIVLELVTAYGGSVDIGHSELGGAKISVDLPGT